MLVICPTPIGNMDDVTDRQRQALAEADIIVCEDTRRAGSLLKKLGIERREGRPKLWRYDEHTAREKIDPITDAVEAGDRVVLTSDAGTPTISDPGYRLVRACRQRGLEVTALPGAVAAVVALSGSGLATDRFFFEGFLPRTQKQRRERLTALDGMGVTFVVYESPRRIVAALSDVESVCGGQREVCVARELTKRHEEFLVGSARKVCEELQQRSSVRGEIVLCVAASTAEEDSEIWQEADRAIEVLHAQGLRNRTIKEVVDELYEVPRSGLYDRIEQVLAAMEE